MQKRKIAQDQPHAATEPRWLPLEALADVEITSEAPAHPIEAALAGEGVGWVAADAGPQTIRIGFSAPVNLRQVRIVIDEHQRSRTQEFVLRAGAPAGEWTEIARQQFNFSPTGATREQEDYRVTLPQVSALELRIVPDIAGGDATASLEQFRFAVQAA